MEHGKDITDDGAKYNNVGRSVGAAIASIAAETAIVVMQLVIVSKELSPLRVLKEGVHHYIAGCVMVLMLLPICRMLSASVMNTAIIILCGAVVYFIVLLIGIFLLNIQLKNTIKPCGMVILLLKTFNSQNILKNIYA